MRAGSVLDSIAFDALFDASPNPYVLLDPSFTIIGMNEAYLRVTMRDRADLVGRNMFDAFPSDPASEQGRQLRDSLSRVARERVRDHIPLIRYDIPRLDGTGLEERYWSATHTPLLHRSGELLLILQHTVDVTELHRLRTAAVTSAATATYTAQVEDALFQRAQQLEDIRRAEQALKESEERFRLVAERAPVMLWMGDVDGKCLYLNRAQREFWGVEVERIPQFDWSRTIHPEDQEKLFLPFSRAMQNQTSFHVEARFLRSDGEYRLVHTEAHPRFGPGGEFAGMIGVNVDITETRRAEAALQKLNATLEQQVAERTEQLRRNEEALRHSQKMEALGKLTGGVAHDFNNLLQVISGNLQLLSKDVAGNERAEQRVLNALGGVTRGSRLAAQLLAFGRRQPLAPKAVNLGRLVRRLDDILRRALGEGVEVEAVIGGGLWNTLVDPAQVEIALLNLAINARDAMDGLGRLTIEAGNAWLDDEYATRHVDVGPGQYVMLAVTDTGCGMPPEVVEQAFEPFFTTKPEGQGTGLGLSQVYGFVKQSGGHIKIYSEPGHGTTVRVYLPRTREEEDRTIEIDPGAVIGGSEIILVVEDDESVRETVVDTLVDLGYRVLKSKDAQSALAIVDSGAPIDLLFTDVVMPGPLRSPELARKARERLPDIAVLFTSGYTENAIVHGGRLDAGINLLSKPYTREALARKIREVLRSDRQPEGLERSDVLDTVQRSQTAARPRALRVLLVEDDVLIRMSTADMLRNLGHDVLEAGDSASALAVLAKEPVDVLLTDVNLPGMPGSELAVEACRRDSSLRVVFASGYEIVPGEVSPDLIGRAATVRKPYGEPELAEAVRQVVA